MGRLHKNVAVAAAHRDDITIITTTAAHPNHQHWQDNENLDAAGRLRPSARAAPGNNCMRIILDTAQTSEAAILPKACSERERTRSEASIAL